MESTCYYNNGLSSLENSKKFKLKGNYDKDKLFYVFNGLDYTYAFMLRRKDGLICGECFPCLCMRFSLYSIHS